MATIQLVLQGIDNASKAFNAASKSAAALDGVLSSLRDRARDARDAIDGLATRAVQADIALGKARDSANNAGRATQRLAGWAGAAADAERALTKQTEKLTAAFAAATDTINAASDANAKSAKTAAADAAASNAQAAASGKVLSAKAKLALAEKLEKQMAEDAAGAQATLNATKIAGVDTTLTLAKADALLAAEQKMSAMSAADWTKAALAASVAGTSAARSTNAWTGALAGLGVARGWLGFIRFLTTPIKLFGGAFAGIPFLTQISGWHLLAEAVLEFISVVGPAVIAVGAFGFAAKDAIQSVQRQWTAFNTVMDATGKAILPLTGGFMQLQKAVRPDVYQIWGDALTIANHKTGEFSDLVKGTGTVLDQLAAQFTVTLLHGTAFSDFMHNAKEDVLRLGESLINLWQALANIVHVLPGYGQILLDVWQGFTKILEVVTQIAQPIIGLGLAFHGAIIWMGIAATLGLTLVRWLVGFGVAAVAAARDLYGLIAAFVAFARAQGILEAASLIDPFVWVAIAAAAIVGLILLLGNAKDATQSWIQASQNMIQNAKIQNLALTLQQQQAATTDRLATANRNLAAAQKLVNETGPPARGPDLRTYAQARAQSELAAALAQVTAQQQTYHQHFQQLSADFGKFGNVTGLLVAAGITTKQMLDTSAGGFATLQQQVAGTIAAYQMMGQGSGLLRNDVAVLASQVTDQYTAITNLNQGWDTFISNMTGSQSAFDTFAQGLTTLAANFKKAHEGTATFTLRLGHLHDAVKYVKSGIDSLTPSGIALNQAFEQQITNANALADTWRRAGITQNLFITGIKDSIAPLVRYAAGSTEATAQLVGLAQEAGYNGPASLTQLVKWLGNTSGATQNLKDITNQATIQEGLLSTSMNAQGDLIANKLIGDINQGILAYDKVDKAAYAYGQTVAQFGSQSSQAQTARTNLIKDLEQAGIAAHDSAAQVAAMITKVLGIPPKAALKLVMSAVGTYTISGTALSGAQPGTHITITNGVASGPGLAVGGHVTGGSGHPTADDVPAWLSSGEYVIRASSVNKYGMGMMDMINSGAYAFGGLVQASGPASVYTGQFAYDTDALFNSTAANNFASITAAALGGAVSNAIASATAAGQFSAGTPGGGSPGANAALARQMMPSWASGAEWQAWNYVAMRESGWNQFALNKASGAYGIAQALPPTKYPFAGQAAGGSNPAAQIGWMISYIRSVYGDPVGAARHEQAYNWYRMGGPVRRFQGGGLVAASTPAQRRELRQDQRQARQEEALQQRLEKIFNGGNLARIIAAATAFIRDIARYYHGAAAARRERIVREQLEHLKDIAQSINQVDNKISNARALSSSIYQGLQGQTGLGNITIGGGFAGTKFVSGAQMTSNQLQSQAATLRKFVSVLKELAKKGIGPALIQQLVALGPVNGLAEAQQILAGGDKLIKAISGEERQIESLEGQIGRGVASYQYEGRFVTGKNFLNQLEAQRSRLDKLFRELGRDLGEEAAKWFHVRERDEGRERHDRDDRRRHHHHRHHHDNDGTGGNPHGGQGSPGGALVSIGQLTINEPADMKILNQKINFAVIAAGLGG